MSSESSLKHAVINGVKWLALTKLLIQLFRWGATFFVIRLLTPDDYGTVAIAGIISSLFSALNFFSLGNAIIRFQEDDETVLATLFSISVMVALGLTLLQVAIAPFIAHFYNNDAVSLLLIVTSAIYLLECLAIQPKAILAKELHYDKLAKIDLISGVGSPAVVLVFALTGWGYWSLAFGMIAASLFRLLACGYYHRISVKLGFAFSHVRQHMKFGLQNSGASFIAQTSNTLDIAVGGYLFSAAQIGIYQVGLQVSMIPLRKISPELRRISFPAFSKTASDPVRFRGYFLKATRMVALLVFPLFWGLGLMAEPLVKLVLTDKWIDSIIIIQVLSFILPFRLFTELNNSVANALGRADLVLSNTILSCVALAVAIILLAHLGIVGLAVAWVLSILLTYLFLACRLTRLLAIKGRELIAAMWPPLLGCVLMSAVLLACQHGFHLSMAWKLGVLPIVGASVYALYLFVCHRALWNEFRALIRK